jgi:hypothetical protein
MARNFLGGGEKYKLASGGVMQDALGSHVILGI